jgi:hypothetical protein
MCKILHMTTATISKPSHAFAAVPPEPWGRRLERVRHDVAHYSLDEAATLAGNYMLTTASTISRLESVDEEPTGNRQRSRRNLAYVLCMAYNVDPAEFGLGPSDLPPGVAIKRRSSSGSTKCRTDIRGPAPGVNQMSLFLVAA